MAHDALSVRMKEHEARTRHVLPARTWTVIRLDGRSFHSYTRGLQRPFDARFAADMDTVAVTVAAEVSGTAFAYVQSDEISLLVTDFATENTQPWFGGVAAKMVSVTAALASVTLQQLRPDTDRVGLFDSRVFTLDDPAEVAAYFVWRQRDAVKNSVAMAGQAQFSPRQLHGLHTGQVRDQLEQAGVPWEDHPDGFRFGRVVTVHRVAEPVTWTHKKTRQTHTTVADRRRWVPEPAPEFDTRPDGWLLSTAIPVRPETGSV